jgi:hypothetical protein
LSTPARTLRRRVEAFSGSITLIDHRTLSIARSDLLTPLETALRAMTWSVIALAVALITFRINHG